MSLKQRLPFLRWSVWRLAVGMPSLIKSGQIGDGREQACAAYVEANARRGDIDDVLTAIDTFATEKSILINVGVEKGALLDAAVRRADPNLVLELGTYCGYSALRIARAAPAAKVYLRRVRGRQLRSGTAYLGARRRRRPHHLRGRHDRRRRHDDGHAGQRARFRRRQGRPDVHRPRQARLPARSAERPRPRMAAPGVDRRRRQRPLSGCAASIGRT